MISYRNLGKNGRLGNQLWQLGSTVGLANRAGDEAGFPYWRYQRYFNVPDCFFCHLPAETNDLGLNYLQDVANLRGVEASLRRWFLPTDEVVENLIDRHPRFFEIPARTAVHVRRGDYLRTPELFLELPASYYEEAMHRLSPPYFVFSDDVGWCRANLPSTDVFFVEFGRDYEDLYLMSTCRNFIVANSTFSWWAAWLGDGDVICPRKWWGPAAIHMDETLMFVDGWTLL